MERTGFVPENTGAKPFFVPERKGEVLLKQALEHIKATADELIAKAASAAEVEELRVRLRPHHFP